ncbi:MAG: CDP-alcohol phosphatidyltransferase family protein [Desulfobacteraceae bacterium]|nr:CDP-alcohol phosphatidyltransferase family protein [Desulfobacteraceae bacterium]
MKQRNFAINIPNILTIIRILLVPLFIIFLLKDMFHFALLVFTVAAISDGLDGLFARYLDQRTLLGAYLDPLADKLLLTSAFVVLAVI